MSESVFRLKKLDQRLRAAVGEFWATRGRQEQSQGAASGERDRGGRSAVTGGGHGDAIIGLLASLLVENGVPESSIFTRRRTVDLPLFFRPCRDWDLVVVHEGKLVACLEFKSQVGPSFGNNYNNRAQEAVGDGHDLAVAYREGLFKPSPRPWSGFLMLLEDAPGSRSPVAVRKSHFAVDPEFEGASYAKRYEITLTRLVRESLYSAASLVLSSRGDPPKVVVPSEELAFKRFVLSMIAHASSVIAE
ncbi:MAG: hypothetical protein JJU33_00470 [Phycisphaerales bacterium]|nr:hypothetical protein [Phycisphaerales bacterium]